MRELIANELCGISKQLILRENPFDNIYIPESVASDSYLAYLKYNKDIENQLAEKLIRHFICLSEMNIRNIVLKECKSYMNKFPELLHADREFRNWYFPFEKKEMQSNKVIDLRAFEEINFEEEIVSQMRGLYPSFKLLKGKSSKYKIVFKIDFDKPNFGVIISFISGLRRPFFSVEVGFAKPEIQLDISTFIARSQSMFDCSTLHEIRDSIGEAIEFLKIILPSLIETGHKTGDVQ